MRAEQEANREAITLKGERDKALERVEALSKDDRYTLWRSAVERQRADALARLTALCSGGILTEYGKRTYDLLLSEIRGMDQALADSTVPTA